MIRVIMHEKTVAMNLDWWVSVILKSKTNEMVGDLSGMALEWNTILCSWIENDELVWIQYGK